MLLTPKPASVLTHEQNILWSASELRKILVSQPVNDTAPRKIIEAEGFYASDVISIQEITPPASTPRHVVRLLVPIAPGYYGASQPVWDFAGVMALGLDTPIGSLGLRTPYFDSQLRHNPTGVGSAGVPGIIERKLGGEPEWSSTWSGASGGVAEAYFVVNGPSPGLWIKQTSTYNSAINRMVPGIWTYEVSTQALLDAAIAQPGTVRL